MKKVIYVTFFASLLAFLSISVAQDLTRIFSGRIQTVDAATKTIVVMSGEKEMVFRISENVAIKTDYGEKLAFNELKITMSVTVEYTKEGDNIHPLSVKVNTMPKAIGKKQKPEFDGSIQAVDVVERTIVVMNWEKKEMVFKISENAMIRTDKAKKLAFNELKIGMSVTVEYTQEGDNIHPLSVKVNTMPKGFGKKEVFDGKIETVDLASRTITVKGEEKSMDFHIFRDTKIKTDSGDYVDITKLKEMSVKEEGMSVKVLYYKMGIFNHPLNINASSASKSTGKKQKAGKK